MRTSPVSCHIHAILGGGLLEALQWRVTLLPSVTGLGHSCVDTLGSTAKIIYLLLTEHKRSTGEYWPKVKAARTERSKVGRKTTKGQYSPVRLKLARLVSSLLYGTQAMLVLNLPAFENKKYKADDCFHGNGLHGESLTKKEPIRTLGLTLPYNNIDSWLTKLSQ